MYLSYPNNLYTNRATHLLHICGNHNILHGTFASWLWSQEFSIVPCEKRKKYSQSTWIAYEKKSGHFSKHHTLAWLKIAQLSCVLFEETWNWGFQMKEAHCVRMDTRKHGRVQQYTHFSTWKPMLYQGSLHPPKDSKMKTRKCENTIFFSSNNIDAKLRTSRSCLSWFLISINWFSL